MWNFGLTLLFEKQKVFQNIIQGLTECDWKYASITNKHPKGLLILISQASLVCPWENERSLWGSPSTQTHWEIPTGQVLWKGMGLGGKIKINVMPSLRRSWESRRAMAVTVQCRQYYPSAEASQEHTGGATSETEAGSLLRGSGLGGTAWHGPLGGPSKGPPHHCCTHDKGFHYCGSVPQPRNLSGPVTEKGSISDRMTHIVQIQGPDGYAWGCQHTQGWGKLDLSSQHSA